MYSLENKIKKLEQRIEILEKRIPPQYPEFNDNLEQRAAILVLCLIIGLTAFYLAYKAF